MAASLPKFLDSSITLNLLSLATTSNNSYNVPKPPGRIKYASPKSTSFFLLCNLNCFRRKGRTINKLSTVLLK